MRYSVFVVASHVPSLMRCTIMTNHTMALSSVCSSLLGVRRCPLSILHDTLDPFRFRSPLFTFGIYNFTLLLDIPQNPPIIELVMIAIALPLEE